MGDCVILFALFPLDGWLLAVNNSKEGDTSSHVALLRFLFKGMAMGTVSWIVFLLLPKFTNLAVSYEPENQHLASAKTENLMSSSMNAEGFKVGVQNKPILNAANPSENPFALT